MSLGFCETCYRRQNIKQYNARSDSLKERALSEYKARSVENGGPIPDFCVGILTNLTQVSQPDELFNKNKERKHQTELTVFLKTSFIFVTISN